MFNLLEHHLRYFLWYLSRHHKWVTKWHLPRELLSHKQSRHMSHLVTHLKSHWHHTHSLHTWVHSLHTWIHSLHTWVHPKIWKHAGYHHLLLCKSSCYCLWVMTCCNLSCRIILLGILLTHVSLY